MLPPPEPNPLITALLATLQGPPQSVAGGLPPQLAPQQPFGGGQLPPQLAMGQPPASPQNGLAAQAQALLSRFQHPAERIAAIQGMLDHLGAPHHPGANRQQFPAQGPPGPPQDAIAQALQAMAQSQPRRASPHRRPLNAGYR